MAKILVTLLVLLALGGAYAGEGKGGLKKLKKQVASLEEAVANLTRASQGDVVAFHAKLARDKRIMADSTILILPNSLLNKGNAYSNTTGKFTAPRDGIYYFSASSKENTLLRLYIRFALTVNGEYIDIAGNQAGLGRPEFLSVQGVVQLSAGDEVWITHKHGRGVYLTASTDFVGFRVA